jgi:CheY-like chemotaxis protein
MLASTNDVGWRNRAPVPAVRLADRGGRYVAKTRTKKPAPPAVLVAEDEPTVRVLAESIIGELGYATFSAANAREALALLENGEPITLLFTDINMPDPPDGIDGLELARVAVESRPGLRVIYTTGGVLTDGMTSLFVEGGTFLQKPYTREDLVEAVRAGVDKG